MDDGSALYKHICCIIKRDRDTIQDLSFLYIPAYIMELFEMDFDYSSYLKKHNRNN